MAEDLRYTLPSKIRSWIVRIQAVRGLLIKSLPFVLAIAAAFLGVLLYFLLNPAPVPLGQKDIDQSVQQAMASATPHPAYSSQVYQIILPSLVSIQVQREKEESDEGFGIGSGVVINDSGDILTALHVVHDAIEIEVYFADGSKSTAVMTGSEPENDIAVLHPLQPPELIVPAVLGSSEGVRIGDEAFAVGNPLGFTASMTAGVISGFNRSIPLQDDEHRLEGLIQFDTAINPGSSGGPLLNRNGQVIGIVTALANPFDQNFFIGIGFAVPIGTAVTVAGGPSY